MSNKEDVINLNTSKIYSCQRLDFIIITLRNFNELDSEYVCISSNLIKPSIID